MIADCRWDTLLPIIRRKVKPESVVSPDALLFLPPPALSNPPAAGSSNSVRPTGGLWPPYAFAWGRDPHFLSSRLRAQRDSRNHPAIIRIKITKHIATPTRTASFATTMAGCEALVPAKSSLTDATQRIAAKQG
jgi:hypothetical protein